MFLVTLYEKPTHVTLAPNSSHRRWILRVGDAWADINYDRNPPYQPYVKNGVRSLKRTKDNGWLVHFDFKPFHLRVTWHHRNGSGERRSGRAPYHDRRWQREQAKIPLDGEIAEAWDSYTTVLFGQPHARKAHKKRWHAFHAAWQLSRTGIWDEVRD